MAILKTGINGAFSGTVGPVVGYERFGKATMRSKPKTSVKNKKGTKLQKASRSVFKKMQDFLEPILPQIRMGFGAEGRSRQMTAHNAAMSHNLLHAVGPSGEIDYSKITTSYGKLPGAVDVALATDDAGIHVSWKNNTAEFGAEAKDQVVILAYAVAKRRVYNMTSGARRSAGQDTIAIHPIRKGVVLHLWLSFLSDDRERVSMSTYLGTCKV